MGLAYKGLNNTWIPYQDNISNIYLTQSRARGKHEAGNLDGYGSEFQEMLEVWLDTWADMHSSDFPFPGPVTDNSNLRGLTIQSWHAYKLNIHT